MTQVTCLTDINSQTNDGGESISLFSQEVFVFYII